jgi:hypothetical protein
VRSPDGEQSEYLIGKMSIQRAAVWLLEQYYKDFNAYKIISLFIVLKSTYSDYFIGFIKLNTEFPRS